MSLLVDSNKPQRKEIVAATLAKAEVDKTSHCWSSRELGHAKNNCPSKQKKELATKKPKWKAVMPPKSLAKEVA